MRVLITGASSGLGKAIALEFAEQDVDLVLMARSSKRLSEVCTLCEKRGAKTWSCIADVSETESVRMALAPILSEGGIDLVIANAGVTGSHSEDGSIESAEVALAQINTNLGGVVNVVTTVAPYMQKAGKGTIVLISSLAGMQPIKDGPAYGASKAGIIAYGEAMREYLDDYGVFVSVVCPGYIKTPMADLYKSWRPLELSASAAAKKVRCAVEKRKPFYPFPALLALSIRLGYLLPWKLRKKAGKRFNYER
ncbi:SDR family NAD(P)-dependent oxidoreductase [Pseudovibrio sp. SPO723]|uniref:SDR family NAD(P)-dependent oxidoreductase n=1 Tax=Nesiotobacter zosterae TaxID=392721 RepID=UPI0029C2EC5F|nr:SDR family NAD(P)-dependent oxidoreductase [Pseudovibrio sp. SPO723]MDX5594361.1 SDR family NAD(P)-dependent oxidoreductase [Pseudovibrio sp. SPO723]